MWFYLLGLITAPLLSPILKPALRAVVKGSLYVGDEVKKIADSVREDVKDIQAETKAAQPAAPTPPAA